MTIGILFTAIANQTIKVTDLILKLLAKIQLHLTSCPAIFDAVSSATGTIDQLTNGVKLICYAGAALSFAVGAAQYLTGGDESMRKAKHRWIGAAVGLIVAVGVTVIRDYIKSKAQFN